MASSSQEPVTSIKGCPNISIVNPAVVADMGQFNHFLGNLTVANRKRRTNVSRRRRAKSARLGPKSKKSRVRPNKEADDCEPEAGGSHEPPTSGDESTDGDAEAQRSYTPGSESTVSEIEEPRYYYDFQAFIDESYPKGNLMTSGYGPNLTPRNGDAEIPYENSPIILDNPVMIEPTGSNELPYLNIGLAYGNIETSCMPNCNESLLGCPVCFPVSMGYEIARVWKPNPFLSEMEEQFLKRINPRLLPREEKTLNPRLMEVQPERGRDSRNTLRAHYARVRVHQVGMEIRPTPIIVNLPTLGCSRDCGELAGDEE